MSVSPSLSDTNSSSESVALLQKDEWIYAGFWIRVCAYLVDCFIWGICLSIVGVLVGIFSTSYGYSGFLNYGMTENYENYFLFEGLSFFLGGLLFFFYCVLFQSSRFEATPGKMLFRMRVVTYDRKRVGFWRAALLFLVKMFVSFPVLYIGVMLVAFTARKEGLHDLIARTVVERKIRVNILMPEKTIHEETTLETLKEA